MTTLRTPDSPVANAPAAANPPPTLLSSPLGMQLIGAGMTPEQIAQFTGQSAGGLTQLGPGLAQFGIDRTLNEQQQYNTGQQYGLDQSQLRQQYGFEGRGLDIEKSKLEREQKFDPQEQGLAKQLLGIERQQLGAEHGRYETNYTQGRQDTISEGAARGALGTMGVSTPLQRGEEEKAYQEGVFGRRGQELDVRSKEQDISAQRSKADLDDQAKGLGLKGDEYKAKLDNGLAQAGLNYVMTTESLVAAAAQGDTQAIAMIQDFVNKQQKKAP